jgi:hypothetical protein
VAKLVDHNLDDFENDYEAYFDKAFNNLVEIAILRLSTEENSPVYTGYFASSWKARQGRRIDRESRKESDRQRRTRMPWKEAYEFKTTNAKGKETPWGPMFGQGKIKRRFKIPRVNFKKSPVYIGNQAHYAQYALEDGRPLAFIQGEMKNLVENAFREKPRLGTIYAGVAFAPQQQMGGQLAADYEGNAVLEASD